MGTIDGEQETPSIRAISEYCENQFIELFVRGTNKSEAGMIESSQHHFGEAAAYHKIIEFIGALPDKTPAEEPPQDLWLQWGYADPEFGVTWCADKINDDDIHYFRGGEGRGGK